MAYLNEISHTFKLMNTEVTGIICETSENRVTAAQALGKMELLFRLIVRTLSRFDEGSELSLLNLSAGQPFRASGLLFEVVEAALEAACLTEGIFDPTILPCMLAAGYDRSFEKLEPGTAENKNHEGKCDWRKILLRPGDNIIYLPQGCSLDLGGIGKGWAVDQAYAFLKNYSDFAIDAGGDIRVKGRQSDRTPWNIGVADPRGGKTDVAILNVDSGAVCTSTTMKRKWQAGGQPRHHLIDPRTGEPSDSGVISATVSAPTTTRAEVLAKAALIAGPIRGLQLIEKQSGCQGLLILEDGALLSVGLGEVQRVA